MMQDPTVQMTVDYRDGEVVTDPPMTEDAIVLAPRGKWGTEWRGRAKMTSMNMGVDTAGATTYSHTLEMTEPMVAYPARRWRRILYALILRPWWAWRRRSAL
ncbi:hypothetical protein CMI37_14375 [Candidatus Pacearchaeota archaeon]|nr:hypothetical protein [Candidatus Pacearchaeota archaeon]